MTLSFSFSRLFAMEKCPKRLARSFSVGLFIALSATMPFQTVLIFVLAWLFRAHSGVVFQTVYKATLFWAPIYFINYLFGTLVFDWFFKLNLVTYNPIWVNNACQWLTDHAGIGPWTDFSFWTLIGGGLLLPLIIACITYPCALRHFRHMAAAALHQQDDRKESPNIPLPPKHDRPFFRYTIPPKY